MPHEVFISYSHKDKASADAICAGIEANGYRCWIAPRDVPLGSDWGESIVDAIGETSVFVMVFTANANASPQVRREVQLAFEREKVVIPFRLDETKPAKSLEYYVTSIHWLDAFTEPLSQHIDLLVQRLNGVIGPRTPLPLTPPAAIAPSTAGPTSPPEPPEPPEPELVATPDSAADEPPALEEQAEESPAQAPSASVVEQVPVAPHPAGAGADAASMDAAPVKSEPSVPTASAEPYREENTLRAESAGPPPAEPPVLTEPVVAARAADSLVEDAPVASAPTVDTPAPETPARTAEPAATPTPSAETPTGDIRDFEPQNVGLLVVMVVFSLGLYSPYWLMRQARAVSRVLPGKRIAPAWAWVRFGVTVFAYVAIICAAITGLACYYTSEGYCASTLANVVYGTGSVALLAVPILMIYQLCLTFWLRGALNEVLRRTSPNLRPFGGAGTFFFGIPYLGYRMNQRRIERERE